MTWHWWHVSLSWAATLGVLGTLAAVALLRHRKAKRQLSVLESRPKGNP